MVPAAGCAEAPSVRACPEPGPPPVTADLDGDGHADLVFAQTEDREGAYRADSLLYAGPAFTSARAFPTLGADDVAIADLNGDGNPELVFASVSDGENRHVDSLVYWGGEGGPDGADPLRLPGIGASAVTIADVNDDGFPDLFLSNRYNGEGFNAAAYQVDSVLYWGGPDGPSPDDALAIPTLGAADARFADLNRDGWTDLVVASGTIFADASTVYWGGAAGFEAGPSLPTSAPEGVEVADFNGDGWPDLFFANFYQDLVLDIDSVLYWGSQAGFSADRVLKVPTHGATDALAADLDGDGCPELVIANAMQGDFGALDEEVMSAVWRGLPDGSLALWAELPTRSAAAVSAGDADGDGDLDLVFANRYGADGDPATTSTLYWNESGFDADNRLDIPTVGAAGVSLRLEG